MHQVICEIGVQIHFISLTSLTSIYLVIPTLISHHSFTLSLQAQNLPFQQILTTLIDFFYLLNCLRDNVAGQDLSRSSVYFEFCIFIFILFRAYSMW